MEIIPAIDILDGKCVRLQQGKFNQVSVYFEDPVDAAKLWADQGAKRIHVVDLKGSKLGEPQETNTIKRIVASVDIPVQLGGGIRTINQALAMLDLGVERVIIGTSAVADEDLTRSFFNSLKDRVAIAIDARDGRVAVKGWEELTDYDAITFAGRMEKLGAPRVIYTDISRDGMLTGANIEAIKRLAEALSIPIIASGGISTIDDLKALKALEPMGVEGAIVGKALYSGELKLSEALAVATN